MRSFGLSENELLGSRENNNISINSSSTPVHQIDLMPIEVQPKSYRIGILEMMKLYANRVVFSKAYAILYTVMILLNIVMLIWLIIHGGNDPSFEFLLMEIIVTVLLGLEIFTRMLSQGKKYFKSPYNWFEIMVLFLCTASLVLTHNESSISSSEEMDELVSWGLLILRYILQGSRLVALLRHRERLKTLGIHRVNSSKGIIDFEQLDENELELDFEQDAFSIRNFDQNLNDNEIINSIKRRENQIELQSK